MIEKILLSQYIKIENKDRAGQERKKTESTEASESKTAEVSNDEAKISPEAKKAQEVEKFTKLVKDLPEVDQEKVEKMKIVVSSPHYLKNMAKKVSERIAERIIKSIDMRFGTEEE